MLVDGLRILCWTNQFLSTSWMVSKLFLIGYVLTYKWFIGHKYLWRVEKGSSQTDITGLGGCETNKRST